MAFLSEEFFRFFEELQSNNRKEWFHENKKRYERFVKKPFTELVQVMITLISNEGPALSVVPKEAMFRINRDIRFAKDKTPYKTHMGANVAPDGRKCKIPGFYFQVGSGGVMVAGGSYMLDKDSLYKVRQAIAKDPEALDEVLASKGFRDAFGEIKGDANKVLPKEFKEVREQQPLIARKQFYYSVELPAEEALRDDLPDRLLELYRAGKPVNLYLREALTV
ncbi:DUF2461 domain-containing protein [Sulfidibacter corallicola]|uniref:DUF2461 domain-containing protein n=1 Tax=Sulfidibacter corallicola TaxID=2818388 RepID=A0A8A4U6E5_SULCO|nr:DUF2461 domain-containing protein [Sulfidibacter corallicola]QTD54325.1 DUF2461 domain-containing protein [Sulfidibacter corallicola]